MTQGGLELSKARTNDDTLKTEPLPRKGPGQVKPGKGLSLDPRNVEDRKVRLKEAGKKRIGHLGACQLPAAASRLLLWAERNLAVPSWKVLRGGAAVAAAAAVPAQTEEEVGSRGWVGTGPWHRKSRRPQEAWHLDNPLPRQEFKQGGAERHGPDLHPPSPHYDQGTVPSTGQTDSRHLPDW